MVVSILLTLLIGNQIADLIPTIAQLRIKSFKGYPYLYNGTLESEYEYLEAYKNNKHSLVVHTNEPNEQAVIIGAPLLDVFPSAKLVFESENYNPSEYYYCEEVILSIDNRPLVFEVFETFEAQVSKFGYKNICLITIQEEVNHPLKPEDYQNIEPLLKQLGFSKTNLSIPTFYSTFCAHGSVQLREHKFVFWIKKLN